MCYSLLEKELFNICLLLKEKVGFSEGPFDLKAKKHGIFLQKLQIFLNIFSSSNLNARKDGIFLAQHYLKNCVGIEFPDQTKYWQKICMYNRIRNVIAHCYGSVDVNLVPKKYEKKVKLVINDIKKEPTLSLNSTSQIQFSKEFIKDVIDTIESFFEQLFDSIKVKIGTEV